MLEVLSLDININKPVSISDANQNFSRIARMAKKTVKKYALQIPRLQEWVWLSHRAK